MASVQTKITKTSPAPCFFIIYSAEGRQNDCGSKRKWPQSEIFTARHEISAGPVVVWRETEMVGGGSQMSGLIIANTQTL